MIHILTVHWKSSFWIPIQLSKIEQHTAKAYRIYAYSSGFDNAAFADQFHWLSDTDITDHATKLNKLADIACAHAESPDDILVFIDSDAFPIREWTAQIDNLLKTYPLVAIRRDENLGDPQPHPCFCATTVKFWKEIKGDWSRGRSWTDIAGHTRSDVGGNLWGKLCDQNIAWFPLLRSNTRNLHPIFYGIYGNIIYHHGAGSRSSGGKRVEKFLRLKKSGPLLALANLLNLNRLFTKRSARKNKSVNNQVLKEIQTNPDFFQRFEIATKKS